MVIPLPDAVGFVEGAPSRSGATAYHMLHTADSTGPGRTVSCTPRPEAWGWRRCSWPRRRRPRVRHGVERRQGAARAGARRDAVMEYASREVRRRGAGPDRRPRSRSRSRRGRKSTFEEGLRCPAPSATSFSTAPAAHDPLNVATLSPKSQKVSGFMVPTVTRISRRRRATARRHCFSSCARAG